MQQLHQFDKLRPGGTVGPVRHNAQAHVAPTPAVIGPYGDRAHHSYHGAESDRHNSPSDPNVGPGRVAGSYREPASILWIALQSNSALGTSRILHTSPRRPCVGHP